MKNVFLSAIMIAVSFMATAQTFESPLVYKKVNHAKPYEWFMIDGDTTIVIIFGNDRFIDEASKEWLSQYSLDINKPHEESDSRKFNKKTWYLNDKSGKQVRACIYEDESGSTFIVGSL